MKLASRLFIGLVSLLVANAAFASGFTDSDATVIANGTTCKKTTVQFTPAEGDEGAGKIVVSGGKGSCKKIGFAKRIGDLTDVTWNDKKKTVDFTVEDGSNYSVEIKNKANYQSIRQALVDAV
jgi:hypothetical protein